MSHDLSDIGDRLNYCKVKLVAINDMWLEFIGNVFAKRVEVFDSGKRYNLHFTKLVEDEIPIAIRSEYGMLINEIRSCLDGITIVLADRNDKTTSNVGFPVAPTEDDFDKLAKRKISKLSPENKDKIMRLQPFNGGPMQLWELHTVDVERKHVRLSTKDFRTVGLKIGGFPVGDHGIFSGGTIEADGRLVADGYHLDTTKFFSAKIGQETTVATNLIKGENFELYFGLFFSTPDIVDGAETYLKVGEFLNVAIDILNIFVDLDK